MYLFKTSLIVLPLLPLFILIIQSVFAMDDLIKQDEQLTTYESQLKESNSLSVLVERFQDERYFILFNILGKENGTVQIKAT